MKLKIRISLKLKLITKELLVEYDYRKPKQLNLILKTPHTLQMRGGVFIDTNWEGDEASRLPSHQSQVHLCFFELIRTLG